MYKEIFLLFATYYRETNRNKGKSSTKDHPSVFVLHFRILLTLYCVQSFAIHGTFEKARLFRTRVIFVFFVFLLMLSCLFPILGNWQQLRQGVLSSVFSIFWRNYCNSLSLGAFHFLLLSPIRLKTRRTGRHRHGIHITRWRTDSKSLTGIEMLSERGRGIRAFTPPRYKGYIRCYKSSADSISPCPAVKQQQPKLVRRPFERS